MDIDALLREHVHDAPTDTHPPPDGLSDVRSRALRVRRRRSAARAVGAASLTALLAGTVITISAHDRGDPNVIVAVAGDPQPQQSASDPASTTPSSSDPRETGPAGSVLGAALETATEAVQRFVSNNPDEFREGVAISADETTGKVVVYGTQRMVDVIRQRSGVDPNVVVLGPGGAVHL